jgi:hypothetical protein
VAPLSSPVSDRWSAKILNERGLSVTPCRIGEDAPVAGIVDFRIPRSDEVTALINDSGVDGLAYDKHYGYYRLRLTNKDVVAHRELLLDLIRRANRTPPSADE